MGGRYGGSIRSKTERSPWAPEERPKRRQATLDEIRKAARGGKQVFLSDDARGLD